MQLKEIAKETLAISKKGSFTSKSGAIVNFSSEQKLAENGTTLYKPEQLEDLLKNASCEEDSPLAIEVTDETTQAAAYRLVKTEGCDDPVLLNFASARNPGGGFINGAKAQEEDLARCSGLYLCQLKQPAYYEANRSQASLLYTDHLIYSPKVPWFRVRSHELLDEYFLASVITSPAPNAGEALRRDPSAWTDIERVLRRRAGYILAVELTLICELVRNLPQRT